MIAWMLAATLLGAAPPPIAAPCCGVSPISERESQPEHILPPRPPLFRLGQPLPADRAIEDELCSVLSCLPSTQRIVEPPSAPVSLGGGRTGTVQKVVLSNEPVLVTEAWVFIVRSAVGARTYTQLVELGRGTKGGETGQLKRVSVLGADTVWIEIQQETHHTMFPRRVTLRGYVVRAGEGIPDAVALGIPVWVDGADLPGPCQIDVAWEAGAIVVTRRTPEVTPEQEIWLHRWWVGR